jgi:hypothetical protein
MLRIVVSRCLGVYFGVECARVTSVIQVAMGAHMLSSRAQYGISSHFQNVKVRVKTIRLGSGLAIVE